MKVDVAVVLAAGGSTRMGRAKARLDWGGVALVLAHVAALRPFANEVIVVTGADRLEDLLSDVATVHNPSWRNTWPSDSLRLALEHRRDARIALVTPVDVAPAQAATIRVLLDGQSAVPTDPDGRDGHPVVLGPEQLRRARGAAVAGGLRSILRGARRVAVSDPTSALDFDDVEAWHAVRRVAIGH